MGIIYTCPRCGCDLLDLVINTNPPINRKECPNCGWSWEGEPEETVRFPFGGNTYVNNSFSLPPCITCPNNPKNGGSGFCLCTLGLMNFTY